MLYRNRFINSNKARIGEILVQKGLISAKELEIALAEQRSSSKKIGEILVEKKLISQFQLTVALREQYWRNLSASFLFSISTLSPVKAIADTATIPFSGYLVGGCGVSLVARTRSSSGANSSENLATGKDTNNQQHNSVTVSCTTGSNSLVATPASDSSYTQSITNEKRGSVRVTNTVYSNLENGRLTIVP